MRYFIAISYNGKAYHGWQIQPNAITVQEVLEQALSTLLSETLAVVGAGRTDAGVHATELIAHFDTDATFDVNQLVFKLNSFLPQDISITKIYKVKSDAHARFDAVSRTYLYRVALKKNVFTYDNTYAIRQVLDVDRMNAACKILFEYKDFQCFSKSQTDVKTYYCDIMHAAWVLEGDELHFTIKANRFLRNMVRAIVGTMVNIGLGKMDVDDLHTVIQSKSRSEAGFSVPAHGLYLTQIEYPEDIIL
ncbi:tRNA pseudouridine(38-40) synthase TruA [uncultured Algibacter sp.]|uniref:tRNA pseudouridine(38-40) synthase TruA n=1 Tax=uncultured Algibacter sp. TaxID=298659 RepID=UPI0026347A78|nr:tRNA pseudouridine(38-40) synthase TruA [uncultured Algibacter sp.]